MRVAVLMSGGIDSAVAALLLKEERHDVFGIHMVHIDRPNPKVFDLAERLRIPLKVVDVRGIFWGSVVRYFVEEYRRGRTPNPCYFCNRWIKFKYLFEVADSLGADVLASGHYARVIDGKLYRAVDTSKDQSYFLSSLNREVLKRVIFPLGEMRKEEVRKLAESLGLEFDDESQDVCFLKGKSLKEFLKGQGLNPGRGEFIYRREVVGEHDGYAFYTIGQRKGLGISIGRRVYVIGLDPKRNLVYLGEKEDVMYDMMTVSQLNFLEDLEEEFESEVKIRSNFDPVPAEVKLEGDRAMVRLKEKVFAVTPGQVAVFYRGDQVVLSGIIERGVRS